VEGASETGLTVWLFFVEASTPPMCLGWAFGSNSVDLVRLGHVSLSATPGLGAAESHAIKDQIQVLPHCLIEMHIWPMEQQGLVLGNCGEPVKHR
jgi:hypothetical protein